MNMALKTVTDLRELVRLTQDFPQDTPLNVLQDGMRETIEAYIEGTNVILVVTFQD